MPDLLTYRAHANATRFLPLLRQAAGVWNDVLSDLVELREWVPPAPYFSTTVATACNIVLVMGQAGQVRNADHPTRVAVCRRIATDYWQISVAPEVKWAVSWWSRLTGNGENALACLVHELGHVFQLPHATDPAYVMHPEIGGTGKLPRREKEHYRTHFLQLLEDE